MIRGWSVVALCRVVRLAPVGCVLLGFACVRDKTAAAASHGESVAATTPTASPHADTMWLLAPDPARDAVHASDSEASLRARYGDANVVAEAIGVGEGMTEPGTVLFPRDSTRRVFVFWSDTVHRAGATRAEFSGSTSRWVVFPGVSLGTTLQELERLNRGPFNLFGFDFDYSGTVESWNGHLDSLWLLPDHDKMVVARLYPTHSVEGDSALRERVAGERLFSSGDSAMHRLNPAVYDLSVKLR